MSEHLIKAYDEELQEIARTVADMGGRAETQIRDAIEALTTHDKILAARVIESDGEVDHLQRIVEGLVIHILAKRQPVAGDLRAVVAALHISIDLERIGDFAKNIAKRISAFGDESYPNHLLKRIEQMAFLSLTQLKNALEGYARHDATQAIEAWKQDEEIDMTYTSLFRELLTYMMEEPRNITFSTHLLFCAKNIERIGDHTTNMAEAVYFMINGKALEESRTKHDEMSAVG